MESTLLRGSRLSVTVSTVEASDPQALTAAAGRLGDRIAQLDGVVAEQRQALDRLRAAWQGGAGDAAIGKADQHLTAALQLRARLAAAQQALADGGAASAPPATG